MLMYEHELKQYTRTCHWVQTTACRCNVSGYRLVSNPRYGLLSILC